MEMQGGKNHASARYIFTCLAPITRALFVQADDVLLDYLKEDGQSIEPTWFVIFPFPVVHIAWLSSKLLADLSLVPPVYSI